MTYSFTQISQYLRCPRQYRYRYLDGWREREDRAAMMFGRCFENALSAYFAGEDSTAAFFQVASRLFMLSTLAIGSSVGIVASAERRPVLLAG